jgi:hypothetical protein
MTARDDLLMAHAAFSAAPADNCETERKELIDAMNEFENMRDAARHDEERLVHDAECQKCQELQENSSVTRECGTCEHR